MTFLLVYSIIISLLFIALSTCFIYVLRRFIFWTTNVEHVISILEDFENHLDMVQKMDTFMGEPVIENLYKNTKFVSNKIKDFVQIVDFFMEIDEQKEDQKQNEEEPEEQKGD